MCVCARAALHHAASAQCFVSAPLRTPACTAACPALPWLDLGSLFWLVACGVCQYGVGGVLPSLDTRHGGNNVTASSTSTLVHDGPVETPSLLTVRWVLQYRSKATKRDCSRGPTCCTCMPCRLSLRPDAPCPPSCVPAPHAPCLRAACVAQALESRRCNDGAAAADDAITTSGAASAVPARSHSTNIGPGPGVVVAALPTAEQVASAQVETRSSSGKRRIRPMLVACVCARVLLWVLPLVLCVVVQRERCVALTHAGVIGYARQQLPRQGKCVCVADCS